MILLSLNTLRNTSHVMMGKFVQHLYRSLFHAGIVAACMQRVHVHVGALLDFLKTRNMSDSAVIL